ncbi:MAG: response regulator transcription factor [Bacteroidales bacterium]
MKVIIADDSDLILERLYNMLCDFSEVEIVGAFSNGIDTLKTLRKKKADLAILDLKMPGLSGLEVINEIRKEDRNIKIILLTFNPTAYLQQMAINEGADYFYSKVDDFEKLAFVVKDMLAQEVLIKNEV